MAGPEDTPDDFNAATYTAMSSSSGASVYVEQTRKDGNGYSGLHILQTQALGADPAHPTDYWLNCVIAPPAGSGIDPISQPGSATPLIAPRQITAQEFEAINQEIEALGKLSPSNTIPESDARRLNEKHCPPLIS